MAGMRNVPPVSNLDGLIVIAVGVVSIIAMGALVWSLGWTQEPGGMLYVGVALAVGVSGALTYVTMRITNRMAWTRQALRVARARRAAGL